MAWQLGGPEGYAVVARSDERGLSPGSARLVELFSRTAPCLVLIDEWVAFIRQLYGLAEPPPAGSFEANLTFVQSLTEAARAAPGAMVVATLPASQVEIGGEGGHQALERLRNTFGRMESPWLPASAEEGFEIVRRRLFEDLRAKSDFISRDAVIRAFVSMYAKGGREFPTGCGEGDYRRRMEAAYPIHPELFDRLHEDWSGLDKFQRTRGVLRFMASVIQALWQQGDPGLLILPSLVPMSDAIVQAEILKYLEGNWSAVIGKDVDGAHATSAQVDRESSRFGKLLAARRVARSIFVGSAPRSDRNRGIDDRQVRLACAQPGESVSTYGDALRRFSDRATYLYQDRSRHWFATKPSVARLAEDRAAAIERREVEAALIRRLRKQRERGEFERVHIAPESPAEVSDETGAGLVVLGPGSPHTARGGSDRAVPAALKILESRGSGPRLFRNALVFLAADSRRMKEVRDGVRFLMAWRSICDDPDLELEPAQARQAEAKRAEFDKAVDGRIALAWTVALEPVQTGPGAPITWEVTPLTGDEPSLILRMSKAMVHEEKLISSLGPLRLGMAIGQGKLWREGKHLATRQLLEDLASYLYLPRLRNRKTLANAIAAGAGELNCPNFAYAEGFDEETGKYPRASGRAARSRGRDRQPERGGPAGSGPRAEGRGAARPGRGRRCGDVPRRRGTARSRQGGSGGGPAGSGGPGSPTLLRIGGTGRGAGLAGLRQGRRGGAGPPDHPAAGEGEGHRGNPGRSSGRNSRPGAPGGGGELPHPEVPEPRLRDRLRRSPRFPAGLRLTAAKGARPARPPLPVPVPFGRNMFYYGARSPGSGSLRRPHPPGLVHDRPRTVREEVRRDSTKANCRRRLNSFAFAFVSRTSSFGAFTR